MSNAKHPHDTQPDLSLGQKLAMSDAFKALFREGMMLVEEVASYLDGSGRTEARLLPRAEALAYASESMRLTTRLMQMASWLLLQRAVNEGELSQAQAAAEKHKIKLSYQELATRPDVFSRLPPRLQDFSMQSLRLQARIHHLDQLLYRPEREPLPTRPPALEHHMMRLQAAFVTKEG